MDAYLKKHSNTLNKKRIGFVNPPLSNNQLANNLTYLCIQSHYMRHGFHDFEWVPAAYKWDQYNSPADVLDEINVDVLLCSAYVWNREQIDAIASEARNRKIITILGGPHIGSGKGPYDHICPPTKPGEEFFQALADGFSVFNFTDQSYSVYEDHRDYLKEISHYADHRGLEKFIALETTRGCPYSCVYCEWGGGINTKILKKQEEVIYKDIDAILECGFRSAYLTDANFGTFFDRDVGFMKYAFSRGLQLDDVSAMKSKNLEKRIQLIDTWFDYSNNTPLQVSIQSVSDEAMRIAKRTDLSSSDKLKLARHVYQRCLDSDIEPPALELILGMPGSTLDDFYQEVDIIWLFGALGTIRHIYMLMPDTSINNVNYIDRYHITKTQVHTKDYSFETISSCFSFTSEEYREMLLMNYAVPLILINIYQDHYSASEFCKATYKCIKEMKEFNPAFDAIKQLLNNQISIDKAKEIVEMIFNENLHIIKLGVINELNK